MMKATTKKGNKVSPPRENALLADSRFWSAIWLLDRFFSSRCSLLCLLGFLFRGFLSSAFSILLALFGIYLIGGAIIFLLELFLKDRPREHAGEEKDPSEGK
jgi:hypothetical protein